jgi:ferrochelatase
VVCFISPNTSKVCRGVLLVNFGTPEHASRKAVRSFLYQVFDEYLSALPWLFRQICIKGWIVPRRLSRVVNNYRSIWTNNGSPFLVQSENFAQALASALPSGYAVASGMQFGTPSIETAIEKLLGLGLNQLSVLSLFPWQPPPIQQSIQKRILQTISTWPKSPDVLVLPEFGAEPWYEQVLASQLREASQENYEKVLFSFHGLPIQYSVPYEKLCFQTATNVAKAASVPPDKICVAFQSRVGRKRWTEPLTQDVLCSLQKGGVQRILVICPSFVVDCLENVHEVGTEYRSEFLRGGGAELTLVPSLNQYQPWVRAVAAYLCGSFSKG